MDEMFTQALAYLIKAIALALTGLITFYIKTVLVPWLKDKQLYTTVQRFVQAAEKLAETGKLEDSADKRYYVMHLLRDRGIIITPEIEALIESAVEELDWMKDTAISAFIGGDETAAPEKGTSE